MVATRCSISVIHTLLINLICAVSLSCVGESARFDPIGPQNGDSVVVHLYDFDMTSYTAITVTTIERRAICQIELSAECETTDHLRRLLSSATAGAFDGQFVRMKVDVPGAGVWYLDSLGGMLIWANNVEKSLSEHSFKELKELIAVAPEFEPCRAWDGGPLHRPKVSEAVVAD